MEMKIGKMALFFLGLCFLLGILAEEAFFRGQIGISYIVFVAAFYLVIFWRFRRLSFSHQRLGYLILCCIWLLSASYFLNDTMLFYLLNILVIPGLVIFHLVLVTSPNNIQWTKPVFVTYIFTKIIDAIKYVISFMALVGSGVKRGVDDDKIAIWKKVGIGILISVPVLVVILKLLMTADTHFDRLMGGIPDWFRFADAVTFFRLMVVLGCTAAFFGFVQVLEKKQVTVMENGNFSNVRLDAIIAITILILLNAVYILFTIVQFKYFFGGTLQNDFTYAEYARKGFFELLFVTLINLSITVVILTFVQQSALAFKRLVQILLTVLIFSSSVMLCSAFLRLSMYEEAYGFTFTRVLAHSFMIFLGVIFAYTLIKIWLEKLSLVHFYFIAGIIYYTIISIINMDGIVVKENIHRYEITGKIDIYNFQSMSASGTLGLIQLYEQDQNIPGLKTLLLERKKEILRESSSWQSFNIIKEEADAKLKGLKTI